VTLTPCPWWMWWAQPVHARQRHRLCASERGRSGSIVGWNGEVRRRRSPPINACSCTRAASGSCRARRPWCSALVADTAGSTRRLVASQAGPLSHFLTFHGNRPFPLVHNSVSCWQRRRAAMSQVGVAGDEFSRGVLEYRTDDPPRHPRPPRAPRAGASTPATTLRPPTLRSNVDLVVLPADAVVVDKIMF